MGVHKVAPDVEKLGRSRRDSVVSETDHEPPPGEAHRQLKNRHVAMISMGGAIGSDDYFEGTGLFIATGTALQHGGPLSLVLGYTLTGVLAWSLMCSLALADRFFSPSLAFTLGWSYWYLCEHLSFYLVAELSAAAILMSFWTTKVSNAVWITVFLFAVAMINLGGAKIYGEMEFWFASIKILTIVTVVILGIILDLGGVTGDRIGFRYWKDPGKCIIYQGVPGATGRFLGFFSVLINAAFAYVGVEMPAIAAAEAKNPRRNLPKAIKRVAARVLIFSPFVIAMKNAGIKGLPSVVNASLLSGAWSAASSDLYIGSRSLYGLSITGNAPRFLTLAFMSASDGQAGKIFGYLACLTSTTGLLTWAGIFAGTMAQGYDRSQLPYQSPVGPLGACFTSYFPCVAFFALYIAHRWWTRTSLVEKVDMDFVTGSRDASNRRRGITSPKLGRKGLENPGLMVRSSSLLGFLRTTKGQA
ncbi:amino acid permease-domain-containing protein [Melampsora americana]|nr:amino acid permease-domain-containing protein [Melampsora americana]